MQGEDNHLRETPLGTVSLLEAEDEALGAARPRLTRAERRRLQAQLKRKTFPGYLPRLFDLPVVIVLALVFILLGPPTSLGTSLFVKAQGVTMMVSPGTSGGQVAAVRSLDPRPGPRVDLAGDVRSIGRARPGQVVVSNSSLSLGHPLRDGAELVACDGKAAVEQVKKTSETIPYPTEVQGEGPIVALSQAGQPGLREALVGVSSKRTGATLTAREPRPAILKRSSTVGTGQKAVALTFDDGPDTATEKILRILAEKKVLATFFVIGANAAAQPQIIEKMRQAGHEIENHTWSHSDLTRLTADRIREELSRTSRLVGGCSFLRPPYGTYNETVTSVARELGLRLALWDVDTRDWESKNADAILAQLKRQVKPGAIILLHDGGADRSATVEAVPRIIDWLLQNGYAIAPLKKLL